MRCSLAIPFVLALALPWACNRPRRSIEPAALRHAVVQEAPVFRMPAWFESAIVLPAVLPAVLPPVADPVADPVAEPMQRAPSAAAALASAVVPTAPQGHPRPTSSADSIERVPRPDARPFVEPVDQEFQDPLDMQDVLDILGSQDSQDSQDEDVAAFLEHDEQEPVDRKQVVRCPFCYRRLPEGLVHVHEAPPTLRDNLSLDFDLLAASKFMFRGVPRVETGGVIQSRLEVGAQTSENGSILLGYFGNMNLSNSSGDSVFTDGNAGDLTEIDLFAHYAHEFGSVAAVLGFISYNFPNHNGAYRSNREVYLGVEDVGQHIGIRTYVDIADINGVYVSGWAQHSFALSERLALLARVQLGWADTDMAEATYGRSNSGFADLLGTLELSYTWGTYTRFFLGLHGSTLMDSDLEFRLSNAGIDVDQLWATLGVHWSF